MIAPGGVRGCDRDDILCGGRSPNLSLPHGPNPISATASVLPGKSCFKNGSRLSCWQGLIGENASGEVRLKPYEYSLDHGKQIKTPSVNSKHVKATKDNGFVAVLMFPCQYVSTIRI